MSRVRHTHAWTSAYMFGPQFCRVCSVTLEWFATGDGPMLIQDHPLAKDFGQRAALLRIARRMYGPRRQLLDSPEGSVV